MSRLELYSVQPQSARMALKLWNESSPTLFPLSRLLLALLIFLEGIAHRTAEKIQPVEKNRHELTYTTFLNILIGSRLTESYYILVE